MSANSRYLDALSLVSDPTTKIRELDRLTTPKQCRSGRTVRALNPMARHEQKLFEAIMDGAHCIRGFTNQDIRSRLTGTRHLSACRNDPKRQSAKVSRILHCLHVHGLIAKIPHARRWRTTRLGRRLMAAALQLREVNFPQLLAVAA